MTHEIETAAAGAISGFFRSKPKHTVPVGTPCANCTTPLQGPWCYACGQLGEDFHRSTWHLIAEAFEGLLHFDGRVWTTLPDLFRHPARLTRAYLEGHRAPQIPPLRLFLVVLLVVFFAGSVGGRMGNVMTVTTDDHGKVLSKSQHDFSHLTPEERAQIKQGIAKSNIQIMNRPGTAAQSDWFKSRLTAVMDDPERFKLILEQWSERFAFLMLPLAAGLLSLLFVFQRRFFVFDHVIFSLHSLSAVGLMLAVASGFSRLTASVSDLILLAAPVHLFIHMRGVYGTGIFGTLVRMALLFIGSAIGAMLIFLGLLWVGLSGMGS
ncbi:MAG: DUF3667 domain-containing protein [Pseudomonadota bacterium]|nr:DUF3667 domain-containing protein [Pseudomonadota bacterium]